MVLPYAKLLGHSKVLVVCHTDNEPSRRTILADGGVYEGLPRDVALELAAQTVFGSAKMVLESTESPAVLRDAVISPAGTTARGVAKLDEGAFRSTVVKAVIAAAERSAELGKL